MKKPRMGLFYMIRLPLTGSVITYFESACLYPLKFAFGLISWRKLIDKGPCQM